MDLDLLVGSGGVLSHAPRREQSAKMLIDSFMPEGITQLAVDSIFMMPQLGVLANIEKEELAEEARKASLEVFHKDCLIRLGTCIAPVGKAKDDDVILAAQFELPNGQKVNKELRSGELFRIKVEYEPIKAIFEPEKKIDVGAGPGETVSTTVFGGVVGIILDGRDRPIHIPNDSEIRLEKLKSWSESINEYPD
tara:strand:+ start:75 stop:656 length:582 start_codon:yes stop_codon:yes gene_type:complete